MLYEAIKHIYPNAVLGKDFSLRDDGEGPFIEVWNIEAPKPSADDLLSAHEAVQLAARISTRRGEILADLERIDAASARPLRAILVGSATDADRARLTELDNQAAALRAELAALPA